jgi:hypothetical protein
LKIRVLQLRISSTASCLETEVEELELTEEMEVMKGGGLPLIHEETVGRGSRKGSVSLA